jgi:hypothetical protein
MRDFKNNTNDQNQHENKQKRNNGEEETLFRIKNTSSFLSLTAVILSIEATREEYLGINVKEAVERSDELTLMALYISLISILIDLGTAKYDFDKVYANLENESPLNVKAVNDLLISRLFSVVASFFLIRSVHRSIDARDQTTADIDPNIGLAV